MELVDSSAKILAQALCRAREFAQTDPIRMIRRDPPKAMLVGSQRIRRPIGIAAIVFRSGGRVPIPETIQRLGMDREPCESSLQESFHHRPARHLDGHGDAAGRAFRQVIQASQELRNGLAARIDLTRAKDLPLQSRTQAGGNSVPQSSPT